ELYLRLNRFDRLVARLELQGRENNQERDMTLCLAQGYQAAGDYGSARESLEGLLTEDTRDTGLLRQLSTLAETEGDYESSARYQQRVNEIAPSQDGTVRLAQLYTRAGDIENAEAVWVKLVEQTREPHHDLQAIDSLMSHSKHETVIALTGKLLRDDPQNWEALFREGLALSHLDRNDEARERFEAILAIKLDDDEQSAAAKARAKRQSAHSSSARQSALQVRQPEFTTRLGKMHEIRRALGLNFEQYYYSMSSSRTWSPGDFGQARMAALAWLHGDAEREDRLEAFLERVRPQDDDPTDDEQAHRDWLYLQTVTNNQQECYETARVLSKLPDAGYRAYYLGQLTYRTGEYVQAFGNQEQNAAPPPLPAEELEHVLACYASLRAQRPEWLPNVLSSVMAELARAGQDAKAEELFQQVVAQADTPAAVWKMIGIAGQRGDLDATLALLDQLDAIEVAAPSRNRFGGYYFTGNVYALTSLMAQRAKANEHGDILRLYDRAMESHRRRREAVAHLRRRGTSRQQNQTVSTTVYNTPASSQYIQLDWPQANEYHDSNTITLLRNAYALFKHADLLSDLTEHVESNLATATGEDRVYELLALAYLSWWDDRKEQAVESLAQATEVVPADVDLRMDLALLTQRVGDSEQALAIIDAVEPLDHRVMQQRETMALNLAVLTGDIERARTAAERLFGLRLDTNTQVALARQMHQLGMHELAEAVLARARRRAGNQSGALVMLMQQYQTQGQNDVAVQIAHQILRRTTARGSSRSPYSSSRNDDGGRQQAMLVLARSGQLDDLIARAEKQLESSPDSAQLHQMLADYYKAAGDREKAGAQLEKIAALRPEDASLRYQLAQQLVANGEMDAAIDHFIAAIKAEPSLMAREYYRIPQYFRQAERMDDLVALFNEIDLRRIGRYSAVSRIISELVRDAEKEASVQQGMALFRKAWQAFPNDRASLIGQIYNDRIWETAEMYDYGREAVIPSSELARRSPWTGIDHVRSFHSDGKVSGTATYLLAAAEKQNRLPELTKEVEAKLEDVPHWTGGHALLAILHAKAGKMEQAQAELDECLKDESKEVPVYAAWILAQELEPYDQFEPQVIKLYEQAQKHVHERIMGLSFTHTPGRRLVALYEKHGQKEKARALVLEGAKVDHSDRYGPGNEEYLAREKVERVTGIGRELVRLGYPVDAIRVMQEVASDTATMNLVGQSNSYYVQRFTKAFE
ncbi:MAG: tetratricopeptide repeat protein, partial [Planctomycetaceae bacterium]